MTKFHCGWILLCGILLYSSCSIQQGKAHVLTLQKDTLADKVLLYQLPNGGWPKQLHDKSVVNYEKPLTPQLLEKIKKTGDDQATLDNKATTREILILIEAFSETKNQDYLKGVERGVQYLLNAQYDHGGFPQYYPNRSMYRAQITFNDGAMIGALQILDDVAKGKNGFDAVRGDLREAAAIAVEKGVDCILRLQIRQADTLTIWAAQYDEKTFEPAQARAYEPAALTTSESVGIVRFLMKYPPLSPAIEKAVHSAVQWFSDHDIEGYRFDLEKDENTGKVTRNLVKDDSVNSWARFYDIKNNRPVFGDRDNSITYDFNEVSAERRHGYAWFGTWPKNLVEREYLNWMKKVEKSKKNNNEK